ncbi:hypothetical protein POF50_011410 [Streptomyces sp. SL13]|uniref:Uncharacterized protein n=1 Tax=Streptantibioticus silvisoli TaxID=2705255 RepID=A0AA90H8L6_9ACTN|nr:hypothetical protein [Streptantibioticus silvisoli]MDI5969937.1 hypothetical protein [Streptantibioticus silvisoli]
MVDGYERDQLMLALLRGALRESAPLWLLTAALEREPGGQEEYGFAAPMTLMSAALAHPSCPDALRRQTLQRLSVERLAAIGDTDCPDQVALSVAAELHRREPERRPMAPELLDTPGPAQALLRRPGLHSLVFEAALELLPSEPWLTPPSDDLPADAWLSAFNAASDAWERLIKSLVTTHVPRHRRLLEWGRTHDSAHLIRQHLLGTVPWNVEPALLQEVADEDLADFRFRVLLTTMSRAVEHGASEEEVRSRFADGLALLEPDHRERTVAQMCDPDHARGRRVFAHSSTRWMEDAAGGTWRLILSPEDAKTRYGQSHSWCAPPELLKELAGRFAEAGAEALALWEPRSDDRFRPPSDLRWVRATLVHLPTPLDDAVEGRVRSILRSTGPYRDHRSRRYDHAALEEERRASETRDAIQRMIDDPAAAARRRALGDPGTITSEQLGSSPADVLEDYLSRHAGNDLLIEKTLLGFARSYRTSPTFADVLARHSAPDKALLEITTHLRRRLGGAPTLREAWTRQILGLPDADAELLRALLAWTALTLGVGSRFSDAPTPVISLVLKALGDSEEAWARFASGPASHAGPGAWFRLGEILDAAAAGTPWPAPPSR